MVRKTSNSLKVAEDIPSLQDGLDARLKYRLHLERLKDEIGRAEDLCTGCLFFYIVMREY